MNTTGMNDDHSNPGMISNLFQWLADLTRKDSSHHVGSTGRADAQPGSTPPQQAASSRGDPLEHHVWWGGT